MNRRDIQKIQWMIRLVLVMPLLGSATLVTDFTWTGAAHVNDRNADINTDNGDTWLFSDSVAMISDSGAGITNATIYGGMIDTWSVSNATYNSIHRFLSSDNTLQIQVAPLNGSDTTTKGVFVWKKEDFLNGGDAATVSFFDAADSMMLSCTAAISSSRELRMVVNQGGIWYVSNAVRTGGAGDLVVNPTETGWAVLDTNDYSYGSFSPITLDDILAVGFRVEGTRSADQVNLRFDDFQVDATISDSTTTYLVSESFSGTVLDTAWSKYLNAPMSVSDGLLSMTPPGQVSGQRAYITRNTDNNGSTTVESGEKVFNFYDHELTVQVDLGNLGGMSSAGWIPYFVGISTDANLYELTPAFANNGVFISIMKNSSGTLYMQTVQNIDGASTVTAFGVISGAPDTLEIVLDGTNWTVALTGANFAGGDFIGTSSASGSFATIAESDFGNDFNLSIGCENQGATAEQASMELDAVIISTPIVSGTETPYDSWAAIYGLSDTNGTSSLIADPDGDG